MSRAYFVVIDTYILKQQLVSRFCYDTVKPPNRGHFGDGPFVPCREVVFFSKVLF